MCRSRQCSQSSNGHRPQSQSSRFSCKDHHELESQSCNQYDDSKWYSYEQESVQIQFTTKHLYHTKQTNVVFDEIDNDEGMSRVLTDLYVSRCNGPKDSHVMHDVCPKHFKIDSGGCGTLIPLFLYLELFPNSCVNDLKPTIDHRVQLVYNKNLIKQYGTCYLKDQV